MEVFFKALSHSFSRFLLPTNHSGLLNTRVTCGQRRDALCLYLHGVGRNALAFFRRVVQGKQMLSNLWFYKLLLFPFFSRLRDQCHLVLLCLNKRKGRRRIVFFLPRQQCMATSYLWVTAEKLYCSSPNSLRLQRKKGFKSRSNQLRMALSAIWGVIIGEKKFLLIFQ